MPSDTIATLGDGTFCTFEVYIGLVIWDGQYREIYINESETASLIGMQLLRGYDLRIQAIEGGLVTIADGTLRERCLEVESVRSPISFIILADRHPLLCAL